MPLIGLAIVLALSVLAPPAAEAQQAGKVYRIGFLWLGREPSIPQYCDAFLQSLADSGYVEGRNLSYLHRWADGPDRFPVVAKELVRLKADVIFASSTPTIRAVADATTTIPIVVVSIGDPVNTGLIKSFARPGGNITGVSARVNELNEKLLELLKESLPSASRIAVIGGTSVAPARQRMEVAARSLGVRLQVLELTSPKEIPAAFEAAASARADGLVLLPTLAFAMNPGPTARLALQHRLATIFWDTHFSEAGGLMAYGPDGPHMFRRAGALVAKILKGARPEDLPVEQADRFRLVINLKTAKALGLTIPQTLLLQANQVIE